MASNAESHGMMIPGDLLWTKIGKYPHWPCMVVYKPDEAIYSKILKGSRIYYVQFFGEKATRGWTASEKNTFSYEGIARFPFEGIAKYYDFNGMVSCENGNNGLLVKKKENYFIKHNHVDNWRGAVSEAEEAFLEKDVKERFRSNVFDYEQAKKKKSENGFVDTSISAIGKENIIKTISSDNQVSKAKKSKTFPEFQIKTNKCYICSESHSDMSCISCFKMFHMHCLGLLKKPHQFKCWECESGRHNCDYCKKSSAEVKICSFSKCFKFFHPDCMKKIECGQPNSHECPNHRCFTCYKENPRNIMARKGSFISCQLCPFAYHAKESCIPAGCVEDLSSFNIICPLHMTGNKRCSLLPNCNVSYCIICNQGGNLICCDGCPNAYHETCFNGRNLCEEFYCEDCTKNKQYYYNMVVWCKIGKYRWWPSKIVQPSKFPNRTTKRDIFPGEFPVQCFGTYDYSWTHRGRVIPYEEKHKNQNIPTCGVLELHFKTALVEAKDAYTEYLSYRHSKSLCGEMPEVYKAIKVNRFTDASLINTPNDCDEDEDPCNCKDTDESPCGTNACINRSTLVECKLNKCQTGQKCQNQRFQKKQYKSTKIIKTVGRGWGLSAAQSIKKGDFVIEYVGEIISHDEYRRRSGEMQEKNDSNFYFLWLDSRRMIDAGPMGNNARFINHSCEPNCQMVKWSVNGDCRIGIFALQNISTGDELSFNYESHKLGFEQKCFCGSSNCTGIIGKKNKEKQTRKETKIMSSGSNVNRSVGSKYSKQTNSSAKKHCASKASLISNNTTIKSSGSEYKNTKSSDAFVTSNLSASSSSNVISKPPSSIFVVYDSPSKVSPSRILELKNLSIPLTRIDPSTYKYIETVKDKNESKEKENDSENFDSNTAKKIIDSISSLKDSLSTMIQSDLYDPEFSPLSQPDLTNDEFPKHLEASSTSKEQNSEPSLNAGCGCSSKISKSSQIKKKHSVFQNSSVSLTVPKTLRSSQDSERENNCFVCRKPGDLICCEQRNCLRAYHNFCIGLRDKPDGAWFCPWHICSVCKKRAKTFCRECPTSFCGYCLKGNSPFYCQICDLKIKKKIKFV